MKSNPNTRQQQIMVLQDDIIKAKVDAIVNAANAYLIPGGGVDRAIHRAAGPELAKAVALHHHCEPGKGVVTKAFQLPATFVFHAVGPIWDDYPKQEDAVRILIQTYESIFEFIDTYQLQSVAIPNISTGVYGFPKPLAAKLAIQTTINYVKKHPNVKVYFYCFEKENYDLYDSILQSIDKK